MLYSTLLDREAKQADRKGKGRKKDPERARLTRLYIERIREMESAGEWQASMAELAEKLGTTSGKLQALIRNRSDEGGDKGDRDAADLYSHVRSIVWHKRDQRREMRQRTGCREWKESVEVVEALGDERAIA